MRAAPLAGAIAVSAMLVIPAACGTFQAYEGSHKSASEVAVISGAAKLRATTPLERLGSPADVVAAVKFLLAGTDYATGTILVIDGGRLLR